jgi:hypothetical protein
MQRDEYGTARRKKWGLSTANRVEMQAKREGEIRGGTVRGTLPVGVLAVHIKARKAQVNMGSCGGLFSGSVPPVSLQ